MDIERDVRRFMINYSAALFAAMIRGQYTQQPDLLPAFCLKG